MNYDLFYASMTAADARKREIAARQSVDHLLEMCCDDDPRSYYLQSVYDYGCGNGAFLHEMAERIYIGMKYAFDASVVAMQQCARGMTLNLGRIDDAELPELITAIHVLEHVEDDDLEGFFDHVVRRGSMTYIEVPLELTWFPKRARRVGPSIGHVRFFDKASLRALLEHFGCRVIEMKVFANSLAYERHEAGYIVGTLKWALRHSLLRLAPALAPKLMSYLCGVMVKRRSSS